MENNNLFICDYPNHEKNELQSFYYCEQCKQRICSNCINNHNTIKDFSSHKYSLLTNVFEKAKIKKDEIIKEPFMTNKDIINLNSKDDINYANNRINDYLKVLNNLNNLFRNENNLYKINYQIFISQQQLFKEKLEKSNSNPLLLIQLMSEDYNKIKKTYNDLISKNNDINNLFKSTINLLNNGNNQNLFQKKQITYEKINNNNFSISGVIISNSSKGAINKIDNKGNKINEINKNNKIKFNIEKKDKNENTKTDYKNQNKNKEKGNNKQNKYEKKEDKKQNDDKNKKDINKANEKEEIINKKSLENENEEYTNHNILQNDKIHEENKQNEKNSNEEIKNFIKHNKDINEENTKEKFLQIGNENEEYINEKNKKNKKNFEKVYEQEDKKSLNKNCLFLNIINEFKGEESNFTNRKTKREENNKDNNNNTFFNNIFNQNINKKTKTEELNNSHSFFLNSSSIKIIKDQKNDTNLFNNNNKLIITTINSFNKKFKNIIINNNIITPKIIKAKYIFGLSIKIRTNENRNEKERGLIVFESKQNEKAIIRYFKSNQVKHEKLFVHSSEFPFECSRLININNEAYFIGGIKSNDFNCLGNNFCFKIYYINNNNDNLGEIRCSPMKNTFYRHQSHSVLYSKLYNTIFVLSGYEQTKCEYAKLNEENEISNWEELSPLRSPRENPISFLLNEKYIFLIGGKKNINNNNYDYFDFSSVYDNKMPFWKYYNIAINEFNEFMFNSKGPGIIEVNSKVYVLGGYINNNKNFMAWKISFGNLDFQEKYIDKIEKFELSDFPKFREGYSFYGQQKFMICEDYYVNISIGGKCESIPRWIFNDDN